MKCDELFAEFWNITVKSISGQGWCREGRGQLGSGASIPRSIRKCRLYKMTTGYFVIVFWILSAQFKFNTVVQAEVNTRECNLITNIPQKENQVNSGVLKHQNEEQTVTSPLCE